MYTQQHSHIAGRNVGAFALDAKDVTDAFVRDLHKIGIGFQPGTVQKMAEAFSAYGMDGAVSVAMDALQPLVTSASIATPVQFLQNWLPGFVNVITAARKIDQLVGISATGNWEDEEVVQGIMELTGTSVPYGDVTNIPLSSWNVNFERRTVVRFEEGMRVGKLEEARSARMRVNSSGEKRNSAALALEIARNRVGFYGYNNGANRTYGFLNDPSLPAYIPNPGPAWAGASFLQITGDIRAAMQQLRTQSQDTIDPKTTPTTLAIATDCVDYLSVTSDFGNSVQQWLNEAYPKCRVESAPELNDANGGANVFYLYADAVADGSTDNGRVFDQIVPAKFQVLGVQQLAKAYEEDYSNATAGILCKRPYAVVRMSGI